MSINRGSEWRKWDLHIHSPLTHSTANKYKELDISEFCNKVVNKNISVIGLTNYFYITEDEYNRITNEFNGRCTVIPNIEFRVADKSKKSDYINLHILFNPKLEIKNILKTLARVPLHNEDNKYCCPEDIENLGSVENVSIEFDNLITQLNKDFTIIDDFIIGLPYNGYGGFKPDNKNRNVSMAYKYDSKSHFIFGNNSIKKQFLEERLYENTNGKEGGIKKVSTPKAVIQASDSHTKEDICSKYTWIKAKPTFEGLRQIIYEPEERVQISNSKPDDKFGYNLIDYIQFKDSNDKLFSTHKIYLNPNLNAVIGGKSTGKSNLLRKTAQKIDIDEFKKDNNTIDWITQDVYIKWNSGDDTEKKILYIPQSYLIKDLEKGEKNIANIIETSLKGDSNRKVLYENIETEQNNIRISINSELDKLFENGRIEKNKIDEIKSIGSKDGLEEEIKKLKEDNTNLLKELKIEEDEILGYNKQNELISEKQKSISNNEKDIEILKNKIAHFKLKNFSVLFSNEDLINDLELKKQLNEEHNKIISEAYNKLIELLESKREIILTQNSKLEQEINSIKQDLEPIQQKLKKQNLIKEITCKIEETEKKLKEVEVLQKEVNAKKESSEKIIEEIFVKFDKYHSVKTDFIKNFTFNEDNLKIGYKLKFNDTSIYDWLRDYIVNNKTSYLSSLEPSLKEYKFDENYERFRKYINVLFKEALEDKIPFKGGYNKLSFVKGLLDDWFKVKPVMEYDGDKIEQMSDGKKAFVLLKLLVNIDNSKYPILIDQPEDSLDNRSIYKELTSYLKEKKKQRQIIIVTHNANLVVGADAENIIIANQHGTSNENKDNIKFDYVNGALEESKSFDEHEKIELNKRGIKEHICEILEGGVDAFKKREQKYSIK